MAAEGHRGRGGEEDEAGEHGRGQAAGAAGAGRGAAGGLVRAAGVSARRLGRPIEISCWRRPSAPWNQPAVVVVSRTACPAGMNVTGPPAAYG
jgi:hypothetical protein